MIKPDQLIYTLELRGFFIHPVTADWCIILLLNSTFLELNHFSLLHVHSQMSNMPVTGVTIDSLFLGPLGRVCDTACICTAWLILILLFVSLNIGINSSFK